MRQFVFLAFATVILLGACSDDAGPADNNPPNNQAAHDTIAVLTPPSPGGTLPGYWSTGLVTPSGPAPWALSQRGFQGIYNKLFWTDLRVDGTRIWLLADEPGGGYRHRFNGAMSDSTIIGWIGTWRWTDARGEISLVGYTPLTFWRRQ